MTSNINIDIQKDSNSILPRESVDKLEKLIDEFDININIIDFCLETEVFYDLKSSANNIKYITNLLADCSRHVLIYFIE
jgi:hypothetical protein